MLDEISKLDATAQADLIRRGEVSPLELVDASITQIERKNAGMNAVITPLYEQARAQAVSRRLPNGPFRGVPLLLKDYFCQVAGTPYYEGMRFLRDLKWKSKEDTYLAAKFRAAGFIFLGKTNLPELASRPVTDSAGFGATRNPFDPLRTAGGSSGGSAAAVASGMVAVAHGNDGTGSIRIPASCCGLVGLKPSRGRISPGPGRSGGMLGNISEFVLVRSVRDAAALLDVLAGPMPGDVFAAPVPVRPFGEEAHRIPGRLRIGLLLHDAALAQLKTVRADIPDVHSECVAAVKKAGRQLESLGHTVEEAYPDMLDGPNGLGSALGVLSASGVAAALDEWETRTKRKIGPEDVEPSTWARAVEGRTYSAVQVQAAYQKLVAGVCRVQEWWAQGFDLLVTPTMAQLPPKLNGSATQSIGTFGLFTMPFSFTGQPAISLPLHFSRRGLPVGVQLVADFGREDLLLQISSILEALNPWTDRYPIDTL